MDDTRVIHPDLEHDCATCSGIHYALTPKRCACGWTPHSGYAVADHLRDMTLTGEDHPQ